MGFPTELVEGDYDSNMICFMCKQILQIPYACPICNAKFCRGCIFPRLETKSKCPDCLERLTTSLLTQPTDTKLLLDAIRLKCRFHLDGCQEILFLSEFHQHVGKCEYSPLMTWSCPQCNARVPKKKIREHVCFADLASSLEKIKHEMHLLDGDIARAQNQISSVESAIADLESLVYSHINANDQCSSYVETLTMRLLTFVVPSNLRRVESKMEDLMKFVKEKNVLSARVENAFSFTDRSYFTIETPYMDEAIEVMNDPVRHLYSVSRSVAIVNVLELVLQTQGCKVLVMCAAPGYEVAILSQLTADNGGVIVAQDSNDAVGVLSKNLWLAQPAMMKQKRIVIAWQEGVNNPYASQGPYHAILNRYAQDDSFTHEVYMDLLVSGGVMIHFVPHGNDLVAWEKSSDNFPIELDCKLW